MRGPIQVVDLIEICLKAKVHLEWLENNLTRGNSTWGQHQTVSFVQEQKNTN